MPVRAQRIQHVMQDTIINFYSTSDGYGDFSNFAAWPIKVDGKTWPTSEHYFQAQKFLDEKYREEIRRVSSPMVAARMGRDRSKPLRKNWESVKEQVMRKALRAKFEQHAELRALLLATAPAKLVEHTENDAYWGDGGHGKGKNRLGYLLMELREQLAIEK
ncbi:N-glycosidase YbiA [Escherichia coli]|uniref:N-glycosidase YbiA n=1 Tax=Escherichia coli TaxID=562 RepID=UPI000B7CA779|nr:N-glycosidase YbiA [Escherichia coli]EHY2521846.1 N-glycosidase YbiA [Escherichia coli]EHY4547952.1 N-glycosidase YbiA [Escherichia coli]EJU4584844.1 N-glycosidase YbiA [Escherichia coli]MBB6995501.1 N-glycosidase YbiA [Escherichia coli]MBB8401613.1 N-glycosidase YbiA [Escherichia coli]